MAAAARPPIAPHNDAGRRGEAYGGAHAPIRGSLSSSAAPGFYFSLGFVVFVSARASPRTTAKTGWDEIEQKARPSGMNIKSFIWLCVIRAETLFAHLASGV